MIIERGLVRIGSASRGLFEMLGNMFFLFVESLVAIRKIPTYWKYVGTQYGSIGRQSFSLIVITSLFTGLVLGIQIGAQMYAGTALWIEGGLIYQSIVLEMGPMVTALVMSGRVGSGIAAEIGSMTVTEQVDAIRTMGIDPVEMLVMPRLVAAIISLPMLTAVFDVLGCFSGFVSSYYTIGLRFPGFMRGVESTFQATQIYTSLIKGLFNGMIIATVGAFFGLNSGRGARGVGEATTNAVIWCCIFVIMVDYILSAALQHIW